MKDFGNWKQSKEMKSAIVSDKPIHETVNDSRNLKAYGGYLVCESVFNDDDVKRLIENAPKLYAALKRIANPIDSIKKEGLKEGLKLNGNVAIQLADDANYLKEIAKEALKCLEGDKDS